MEIREILEICKTYSRLGSALQEQLDAAVEMDLNAKNYNPAAERYLVDFLEQLYDYADDSEDVIEYIMNLMAD